MIQLENPTYVMAGGRYEGDSDWNDTYSQSDNCYKIYHITHGELWVESNEERYQLREGGLYIINGHLLTCYGTESGFTTNWLHFKAQNIALSNTIYSLPLATQLSDGMVDMIETLGGEDIFNIDATYSNQLSRLRLQGVLQVLLVSAMQLNNLSIKQESEEQRRITPALQYIYNNLSSIIRLDDLSSLCNLSTSHFCKLFKSIMNITPNQFILAEKMRHASYLIHSEMEIKRVACEVGFYDDAHFCRTFKNFFGVTATHYRSHISC